MFVVFAQQMCSEFISIFFPSNLYKKRISDLVDEAFFRDTFLLIFISASISFGLVETWSVSAGHIFLFDSENLSIVAD